MLTHKRLSRKISWVTLALFLVMTLISGIPGKPAYAAIAPTLVSATATSNGDVELTFDKDMADPTGNEPYFRVLRGTGVLHPVSTAQLKTGDAKTIELVLSSKIYGGEVFQVSYNKGTDGTVAAADGGILEAFSGVSITNNLPHPELNASNPPASTVGTPYSYNFTVTGGGSSGYSFYVQSTTYLPFGLSLNSSTGELSGTPTTARAYTFKIIVTDNSTLAIDVHEYTMTINEAPPSLDDVSVQSVTVAGVTATVGSTLTLYWVEMPYGDLAGLTPADIVVTPTNPNAAVSTPESLNIYNENWEFVVTAEDGVTTETYHISISDNTDPAFVTGYPKAGDVEPAGSKLVNIDLMVDEYSYLYGVVTSSDTPPTNLQIEQAQDHTGAPNLAGAHFDLPANSVGTWADISLPADGTTYYAHMFLEDPAKNRSDVVTLAITTPPGIGPEFSHSVIDTGFAKNTVLFAQFNQGVYGNAAHTTAINKDDFTLTYTSNGSPLTNVTINDVKNSGGMPVQPGDLSFFIYLTLTGNDGLATGAETLTLKPKDGASIFNNAGWPMSAAESFGPISLLDTMPPQFGDGYPAKYDIDREYGSKMVDFVVAAKNETVTAKYVAVAQGATPPSKSQVQNGLDGNNNAAIKSGFRDVPIAGAIITLSALPADNTAYDIYTVIIDDNGNVSEPALLVLTTPPAAPTAINIAEIPGVTAPVRGATPVTAITETEQYTGTVSWSPAITDNKFAADTEYTATITLTPKIGYTLTGVGENFFTAAGATTVSNGANSGVVTAVFPKTAVEPAPAGPINSFSCTTIENTSAAFTWPQATGATAIKIQYSLDNNATWVDAVHDPIDPNATTAAVTGLTPGTGYIFKLVVEDGVNAGDSNLVFASTTPYGSISGTVKDTNGNPLEGASISVFNSLVGSFIKGTVSDTEGRYSILNVPVGTNRYIYASKNYYVVNSRNDIAVNVGADTQVDFVMNKILAEGYPKAGTTPADGSRMVNFLVKANSTSTTAYYVVLPENAAQPSEQEIMEGKDSTGAAALYAGGGELAEGSEQGFTTGALPDDNTAYDIFVVLKRGAYWSEIKKLEPYPV